MLFLWNEAIVTPVVVTLESYFTDVRQAINERSQSLRTSDSTKLHRKLLLLGIVSLEFVCNTVGNGTCVFVLIGTLRTKQCAIDPKSKIILMACYIRLCLDGYSFDQRCKAVVRKDGCQFREGLFRRKV